MEQTVCIRFVRMRADAEAKNAGQKSVGPEHLFLGLMKLGEVHASDFISPSAPNAIIRDADEEIAELAALLKERKIGTGETRSLLRHLIMHVAPKAEPEDTLHAAEDFAHEKGKRALSAPELFLYLEAHPTERILSACPQLTPPKPKTEDSGAGTEETKETDENSVEYLAALTERIRSMRTKLLTTVQGQDHVVHAFAEGMFAAEVLSRSDENRKRPRAIFVFAGPPGVGKTFLAEQASEALQLPFKRFDMSSYADHQSYMGLIGWEKSYQAAKEGLLTEFVNKNPHCLLLFDEIEKAHLNTVQLFLQILDAGRLQDRYTQEDVSFKDTIIIFTSNACKSLYEGDARQNAAGVPRKTILNALETEKDPRTGQPFFPAAITSRIATGWPLLFNHLQAADLEKISARELTRFGGLLNKQYGIEAEFDPLLPTSLLYREGGQADARTLRAQSELFFKNEVFKLCRLWDTDSLENALKNIARLRFTVEEDSIPDDVRRLFTAEEKPEVLIFGADAFAARCETELKGYTFHRVTDADAAVKIAGDHDIRLVLLDVAEHESAFAAGPETVYENAMPLTLTSIDAFDFAPMTAGAVRDAGRLFRLLHERLPELPVYLLETPEFKIDRELEMDFVRAGARGKITAGDIGVFEEALRDICRALYMQQSAARMAAERKILSFETAPKLSADKTELTIRLREFALKRATAAEDAGSVLDEVEKPDLRFSDVIGASEAKDELQFFINYLKNPKKFAAQGLKPPKGVLLYGPPGTGKTMLAKAMAGESSVAFIPAAASTFVTKWQGSGPEAVRELFKRARRYAPAILFIDEIDAVGRKRGESNSGHGEEMALNALLTEMDGFSVDPKRPVFVLAATNYDVEEGGGGMGVIDPALARRFDRRVLVDLPNTAEREELLRVLLKKNKTHVVSEEMIKRTAERSAGMSPANLTSVIELANRMAVKANKPMDDAILDEAFELTRHGAKKDWGYEYLERVARHESGHAFLCYLGGHTPSYLTIVARGNHGGYMEHSQADMGPLSTRKELIDRIRTSLGGRAAEIVYYGPEEGISTGASGDLEQATRVATAMLTGYGMDDDFGLGVIDQKSALADPEVRKRVNAILRREMEMTVSIIEQNRARIDRMVSALMQKNKLSGEEMEALLKD